MFSYLKEFKTFSINFKFAANQLPSEYFSCASEVNSTFKAELGVFQWPRFGFLSKSWTLKQHSCLPMSLAGPGVMTGKEWTISDPSMKEPRYPY